MSREALVAYLWPDQDSERGRRLLSDSVYRINQALGADTVLAPGDELRLNPAFLSSDVSAFEEALSRAAYGDAVANYGGPLLDGFFLDGAPEFERWTERERQRLARLYATALESLAEASEREGEFLRATESWYKLAAHDPFSPRIAIRLMQALDAAGERAAALQHAKIYEILFQQEFNAPADPAIATLVDRLRSEPFGEAASRREMEGHGAEAAVGLGGVDLPLPEVGSTLGLGGIPKASITVPADQEEPKGGDLQSSPGSRSVRRRWMVGIVASAPLAIAGLIWHGTGRPASPGSPPAVAVLPFADHSPGGDHAYFGSGMTEEIASALTKVDGLRVVAHTPSVATRGADIQAVGKRLGVGSVLQGSVTRWGDSVRINARLVRVADRRYLWSERYTSEMGSIFAIQDSISRAIVATLTEELLGPVQAARGEPSATELEAYNLALKGRYAWHRRTQESLARAVSYFEQAIALDPLYARGHAGLADAYAVQGFYDYRAPGDAFPKAETTARRALVLDRTLAQPHATLGYVNLYYHWKWVEAEQAFRRAIRIDPGYSTAHQWYGNYLTAMGRFENAEEAMRRAMELDPLSLIANAALGWVYYYAGHYERAVEQCLRTLELDPNFRLAYLWSGLAYEQLGQTDEAIQMLERSLTLSPRSAITIAALAHAYATAGRREQAVELLNSLLAAEERYVPSYEVAKLYLALGQGDKALDWLEIAYEQRSHSMAFLKVDPQLTPLHSQSRFRELLKKVGHET